MKRHLLIAIITVLSTSLFAQSDCPPPTASIILDENNAAAYINNGQLMWHNVFESAPGYEIPKEGGVHSIYAGNFWIGGVDGNGTLKMAAGTYNNDGNDFFCGPLSADGEAETTEDNCLNYDRFWVYTEEECLAHFEYFSCVADPYCDEAAEYPDGYEVPDHFLDYPAHGDDDLNQAENLAPFFDFNLDGTYDPNDGDCPLFRSLAGFLDCDYCDVLEGDRAVYWIDNDKGNLHLSSYGEPLGIEIHNQAYAYNTEDEINNMTFYKKKIINRTNTAYTDVYMGLWVDGDLGNSTNDFVGCDIGRNYGYTYNGTPSDPDAFGTLGYGDYPPAVAVKIIQGPLADPDGEDNDGDGTIDNEKLGMQGFLGLANSPGGPYGIPNMPVDYYNLLRSLTLSGNPIVFASSEGSVSSTYLYGGDTYDIPGVNFSEDGISNSPGDRRMLLNVGPFTLEPGEEVCLKYALMWARPNEEQPDFKPLLDIASEKVDDLYANCMVYTGIDEAVEIDEFQLKAYPNPMNESLTIDIQSADRGIFEIMDISGRIVLSQTLLNKEQIDIAHLESGNYIATLRSENGRLFRTKLVKL